jgi:7-carboxy-7-deazaguanine synthase
MKDTLLVNEIFLSVQGESTFAGLPCVFVRLTGCNLRCSYCDTAYAFSEGSAMTLAHIEAQVESLAGPYLPLSPRGEGACGSDERNSGSRPEESMPSTPPLPLVELTGGEPLLQKNSIPLMKNFCDAGFTVLLETGGSLDIGAVDSRVRRIVDLKCPSSGEAGRNRWENIALLTPKDEVKFVIATQEDYAWAKTVLRDHRLASRCVTLFSWAAPLTPGQASPLLKPQPPGHTPISRRELAESVLADALPVRFQAQLHKIIWPPDARGV